MNITLKGLLLWRRIFWLGLGFSDTLNNWRLCRFIDRWLVCWRLFCWRLFDSRLWCRCFFWSSLFWRRFLGRRLFRNLLFYR
jgi:hypothetical protein